VGQESKYEGCTDNLIEMTANSRIVLRQIPPFWNQTQSQKIGVNTMAS